MRQYQSLVGLTPDGIIGRATWESLYRNYTRAAFALQNDTVRAQAANSDNHERTTRVGQYPGYEVGLGQSDGEAET